MSASSPSDCPSATTFELSVFGAGVGEALAVHLGDNEWMLVDSCVDHRSGQPAALAYLSAIGVPAQSVSAIVITHWHEDHVSAVDRLITAYPGARIFVPSAFDSAHLYQLVRAGSAVETLGTGALQTSRSFAKALNALISQGRRESLAPTGIDKIIRRKSIAGVGLVQATALSPSNAAAMLALGQFADFVEKSLPLRRRPVAEDPNHSAIALWIQWGTHRVILGSDLVQVASMDAGWNAALTAQILISDSVKALVAKAAHHGSANGHSSMFWQKHVSADVTAMTTYAASKSPPPQEKDIERLKSCSKRVICAPKPIPPRSVKGKGTEKFAQSQGIVVTRRVRRFGHARIRIDPKGELSASCYGEACDM